MRDIVPLPELANFSFQLERAIIQRKPAARISFEFGGHLSFHNPPQTQIADAKYNFFETQLKPHTGRIISYMDNLGINRERPPKLEREKPDMCWAFIDENEGLKYKLVS
jgi:hypothetical protein